MAQTQRHPDFAALVERVTSACSTRATDLAEAEAFLRRGLLLVGDPRGQDERRSYDLTQALAAVPGSSGRREEAMARLRREDEAAGPATASSASWSLIGGRTARQPRNELRASGPQLAV